MPITQNRLIRAVEIILAQNDALEELIKYEDALINAIKNGEMDPHGAIQAIKMATVATRLSPKDYMFAIGECDHFCRAAQRNERARRQQQRKRRAAGAEPREAARAESADMIESARLAQAHARIRDFRLRARAEGAEWDAGAGATTRAEGAERETSEAIEVREDRIASTAEPDPAFLQWQRNRLRGEAAERNAASNGASESESILREGSGRVSWVEAPPKSDPNFAQWQRERERARSAQREAELRKAEAHANEPLF